MRTLIRPHSLYHDGQLKTGWGLLLDGANIEAVGPLQDLPEADHIRTLADQALLPGFINSHSHAFQRVIRGATEYRSPEHPHDDFWSWRELMYQSALGLSPDGVEAVARLVFLEMVTSGITTVGEFHYLHHDPDGRQYADPDELAHRVIRAAEFAGLNIVLLRVAYHRAGYGQPPNPRQRRFIDANVEDCLGALDRLRKEGHATGVAPHSVRAVPRSWLAPLSEYADNHDLPLHMHVSEQPREIDESLGEYGVRPVQLLQEEGLLTPRFTGVHLIHLHLEEIHALAKARANICSCPTTERNLGDGIVAADTLTRLGVNFTLGTDSQCQIDLLEDARQLDYHLRLQQRQRAVLDIEPQEKHGLAARLLDTATRGGARSLCQPAGTLQKGNRADLVAVDLNHPTLLCHGDPLPAIVFAMPRDAISQVYVQGKPLLQDGHHPRMHEACQGFRQVLQQLR